jgi:hypothetical protein
MDEEHVQEHILTGGIVAPVGGASPTHSWPLTAISLGVVASYRQMAKVSFDLRVSAADRRQKAAGEHVVYHTLHSFGQHVMPGNCF